MTALLATANDFDEARMLKKAAIHLLMLPTLIPALAGLIFTQRTTASESHWVTLQVLREDIVDDLVAKKYRMRATNRRTRSLDR